MRFGKAVFHPKQITAHHKRAKNAGTRKKPESAEQKTYQPQNPQQTQNIRGENGYTEKIEDKYGMPENIGNLGPLGKIRPQVKTQDNSVEQKPAYSQILGRCILKEKAGKSRTQSSRILTHPQTTRIQRNKLAWFREELLAAVYPSNPTWLSKDSWKQ